MTLLEFYRSLRRRSAEETERPVGKRFRVATTLAAAMVPAHGFVSGVGAVHSGVTRFAAIRSQAKTFFGQLIKGCLWAAAIAAGMLIYTSFMAKWKEKGWPTIPIQALVAADQAMGPRQQTIPLGGAGSSYTNGVRASPSVDPRDVRASSSRQTSLLDLDQYEG